MPLISYCLKIPGAIIGRFGVRRVSTEDGGREEFGVRRGVRSAQVGDPQELVRVASLLRPRCAVHKQEGMKKQEGERRKRMPSNLLLVSSVNLRTPLRTPNSSLPHNSELAVRPQRRI